MVPCLLRRSYLRPLPTCCCSYLCPRHSPPSQEAWSVCLPKIGTVIETMTVIGTMIEIEIEIEIGIGIGIGTGNWSTIKCESENVIAPETSTVTAI